MIFSCSIIDPGQPWVTMSGNAKACVPSSDLISIPASFLRHTEICLFASFTKPVVTLATHILPQLGFDPNLIRINFRETNQHSFRVHVTCKGEGLYYEHKRHQDHLRKLLSSVRGPFVGPGPTLYHHPARKPVPNPRTDGHFLCRGNRNCNHLPMAF